MSTISLKINGVTCAVEADPSTPLIYVLRNHLGLVGAKLGCGLEQCGACAVLADGEPVSSCVRAVSEFEGSAITTIEGLSRDGVLSPVQRAFLEEGAAQCGYCTAGIIMAVTALLRRTPRPDRSAINAALDGHLCRCGSHAGVLKAIDRAVAAGASHGG